MSHTRPQRPAPLELPHQQQHHHRHHRNQLHNLNGSRSSTRSSSVDHVVRRGRTPVISASTSPPLTPGSRPSLSHHDDSFKQTYLSDDPYLLASTLEARRGREDDAEHARPRVSSHENVPELGRRQVTTDRQTQRRIQTRTREPALASALRRTDLLRASSSSSKRSSRSAKKENEAVFQRSSTMPPSTSRKQEELHSSPLRRWDTTKDKKPRERSSHSSLKDSSRDKKPVRPELVRSSTGSGSSIRKILHGVGLKKAHTIDIRHEDLERRRERPRERKSSTSSVSTKEEHHHHRHRHHVSRSESYSKEYSKENSKENLPERRSKEKVKDIVEVEDIEAVADEASRPKTREHKRRSPKHSTNDLKTPKSKPKIPEKLITCTTCLSDDIPESQSATLSCTHTFCNDCLVRLFTLSLTDPQHMPPRCCTADHIPLSHVTSLLNTRKKILWNKKYQEYTTSNRTYCPIPTCGEWIKPSDIHPDTNTGTCSRCNTSVCTLCSQKSHPGDECPKDEEMIKIRELGKELGWQRCFSCRAMVELEKGCNHMTCRCTAEFCMICGLKWKTCECPWFNFEPDPNDLPTGLEEDLVWEEQEYDDHRQRQQDRANAGFEFDGENDGRERAVELGWPPLLANGWMRTALESFRRDFAGDDMGFGSGNSGSEDERVRSRSTSRRRGRLDDDRDFRHGYFHAHSADDFHNSNDDDDDDLRLEYQAPAERAFLVPMFRRRMWISGD